MSELIHRMEQVRKLKNGNGIQNLLDGAAEILGNPMVLFDTEYNRLAHTSIPSDDPLWLEITTQNTFSRETQTFFHSEGFLEELANAPRIAFMGSDKLPYNRIGGKIFNKNNCYVANLVIVESSKPFEKHDPMVFEAVCKLISKEISRSPFFQEYEQAHQEKILANLIDGDYDVNLDIGQVGILYDSLESNLYLAVVDISQAGPEQQSLVHYRDLFRRAQPAYKYAIYDHYILMILSTDDESLCLNKGMGDLMAIFDQHNLYAGISSRFENLFELRKHYDQALQALQQVAECRSNQRFYPCNPKSLDIMAQIQALDENMSLQDYMNIAPQILGNPVLFHDMELKLLSCTENMDKSDPICEELITYGVCSDETAAFLKESGFVGSVENTKAGAILKSDQLKHDRISWKIYSSDNIMVGCLCLVGTQKPLDADDLVLHGSFCRKVSKVVSKIEFYNNYGQVYSDTLINRLINGKIDDYTFFTEDIGNIYDDLMDNLYLLVVDASQCDAEQGNLTYVRNLFSRVDTINRYALYEDYIIIISSTNRASLRENDGFLELCKVLEQNKIRAGISSCFGNIYDLRKYYNEAVCALSEGLRRNGPQGGQRVFSYSDLFIA